LTLNRSESYKSHLITRLKDSEEAIAYLNAVIKDCKGEKEAKKILTAALKDVIDAHDSLKKMVKKAEAELPKDATKPLTTYEEHMLEKTPRELVGFVRGYQKLILSELVLAIIKEDGVRVRELARALAFPVKIARGISVGLKKVYPCLYEQACKVQ
jgi:hypothetical protein